MTLDADQIVTFVGINLLLEEHAAAGERFRQHHALLEVHVVVGGAVDQ